MKQCTSQDNLTPNLLCAPCCFSGAYKRLYHKLHYLNCDLSFNLKPSKDWLPNNQ